jgi:hypothetical protein
MDKGLDYDMKKEIKYGFTGEEAIPFKIIDGVLINTNNDPSYVYSKKMNEDVSMIITNKETIDKNITNTTLTFILKNDGVYLLQSIVSQKLFSYNDYPMLNNLDFNELSSAISPQWEIVFTVFNDQFMKLKPLLSTVTITKVGLDKLFSYLMISLVLAFFQYYSLSGFMKFRTFWKLCIYMLAPYIIGETLSLLFGLPLLYYLGFFASAIYVIILSQTIKHSVGGNSNL